MSKYCLKIKKKKIQIELSTNNAEFIAGQLAQIIFLVKNEPVISLNGKEVTSPIEKEKTTQQPVAEPQKIKTISSLTQPEKKPEHKPLPANFAKLLQAKEQEENKVVEKKASDLRNTYLQMHNIIKEKQIKNEVDYVVIAAYCLSHHENIQHFSEKQLQAKIAPFLDEDLDRNFILDAVDKNLIRVLPDFTGFGDSIEFELTQAGEEYFLNEL